MSAFAAAGLSLPFRGKSESLADMFAPKKLNASASSFGP